MDKGGRDGDIFTPAQHALGYFVAFEPLNCPRWVGHGKERGGCVKHAATPTATARRPVQATKEDHEEGTTIGILGVALAVMAFAGFTAPKSGATTSLCHSSTLSIKAPATVKAGKSITVTGSEPQTPAHAVKATLQYRLSTSKKWVNGKSTNLSSGAYTLKWKAPAKKGKYKIRVRVTHSGTANTSTVKSVTVKSTGPSGDGRSGTTAPPEGPGTLPTRASPALLASPAPSCVPSPSCLRASPGPGEAPPSLWSSGQRPRRSPGRRHRPRRLGAPPRGGSAPRLRASLSGLGVV